MKVRKSSKEASLCRGLRFQFVTAYRRRQLTNAVLFAIVLCGVLLRSDYTSADDKSKKIVGGILKILVESQLRGQGGPNQQQLRPGSPQAARATPELIRARESLHAFRQESITLSTLLQRDSGRNAGLQSFVGDAVQLQARADALAQRSHAVPDHRFSYRLRQVPSLSQPCRACIGQLDQYDAALCDALSIEPQIDRRTLQRQSEGLVVYLHGLSDDIDYELRRSPSRNALMLKTSQAHQAAVGFSDSVSSGQPYALGTVRFREPFYRTNGPANSERRPVST
jgi:hypothetical protein